MTDSIKFNGLEYPIINMDISIGTVAISVESLNEKLMTKDGDYVSEKARHIDELIYYYVEDRNITLSHELIQKSIPDEV